MKTGIPTSTQLFHNGLVVNSIVGHLTLVDKVRLYAQMAEEETEDLLNLTPEKTNTMAVWKDATEKALSDQRVISDCIYNYEKFDFFRPVVGQKDVIPTGWLKGNDLTELRQLFHLCPNLTGIHLMVWPHDENGVNQLIDLILARASKLTALTFSTWHDSSRYKIRDFCRKRAGAIEFIDIRQLKVEDVKELIETNPNLKAIHSSEATIDFVNNYIGIYKTSILQQLSVSARIYDLCLYMRRWNSHCRNLGSDSMQLKGIDLGLFAAGSLYDELVTSFTELEFLSLAYNPQELDIRKLKVMKNIKVLRLLQYGRGNDSNDYVTELFPHFAHLEELHVYDIFLPESTLCQFHLLCPQLRKLCIFYAKVPVVSDLAEETLRSIFQLPKLELLYWRTRNGEYEWKGIRDIDEKRRQFSQTLLLNAV